MEMLNYYISNNTNLLILILCIVTVIMLLLLIINSIRIRKWKNKYNKFMKSKKDFNIEDVLKENMKDIEKLKGLHNKQTLDMNELEKYVRASFQKFALVKYNAFEEMGGELSFVLALLNQDNTGVLINAMHSREGCYIYIKAVNDGKCDKVLSSEEKSTLQKAIKA